MGFQCGKIKEKRAFNDGVQCVTFVNTVVKNHNEDDRNLCIVVRTLSYHVTSTQLLTKVSVSFMS